MRLYHKQDGLKSVWSAGSEIGCQLLVIRSGLGAQMKEWRCSGALQPVGLLAFYWIFPCEVFFPFLGEIGGNQIWFAWKKRIVGTSYFWGTHVCLSPRSCVRAHGNEQAWISAVWGLSLVLTFSPLAIHSTQHSLDGHICSFLQGGVHDSGESEKMEKQSDFSNYCRFFKVLKVLFPVK